MNDLFVSVGTGLVVGIAVFATARLRLSVPLSVDVVPEMTAAKERRPLIEPLAERLASTNFGSRLAGYARKVHPHLRFSDYLALCGCGALGGLLVGMLLIGNAVTSVALALMGPFIGDRLLIRLRGRRADRVARQLPDALYMQASALRAGHSLVGSLREASTRTTDALAEELRRVVSEIDLGVPVDRVLTDLSRRVDSREVEMWVMAMLVQRQTGGDLSAVLESLAEAGRQRTQLRSEIRAMTAQARLSGGVVGASPLVFFVVVSATSRDQLAQVYSTPLGFFLIAVGLGLQALGFLWIRRILRVRW